MATAPQAAPRLAARCPNCQTAFRVVADQLRLRGGLVRCGRCNHVFDGRDHLIELGAPPAPAAPTAEAPQPQQSPEHAARIAPLATPAAPEPETPAARPAAEDDHGFGMTLIWEEDVPEEGVAEVHLGEVEGATPAPDLQSTAPDTRPLPDEAPIERAAEPVAEPVQLTQPAEPPAPPADPFHGLPPIRDLEDEEDAFAAAVPRQPSADLPVEPAIAPPAAPVVTASAPVAVASLKPEAEKHDSVWMRHQTDPHTLFAPVPRRQGHTRRTQAEPAGPTPQRTLTGAPRPRKVRGPNHGVSAATLDFLRAAQAREQTRKTTGRRALARVAIGVLAVTAVLQLLFLARAEIARRVPSTRPMLEAMCQPLHCTIAPPRDLDALQIESSQLQRQEGEASDQYVLTATLRNRAGGPIALPAIELVTTDLQDQLLSRRALLPTDYLNPTDSAYGKSGLPARAELPIRVRFQSQRPTANYRVLIFYP
ncbi:MAG: DUF3426 domain-containing protein [Ralstonia sp.]|uniref:DUF3426 domain-containing protein n=3 Tax=Ralstonia pickettii TaxID=329 RepID=A0A2P4REM0_RALPI|nr:MULTISPECIES: DUF3426 domain-containing protein [Ralstonia]MBA4015029.1 DUF3426 domain-containing protein [Ralstonia sp.]MBA4202058.1 DUF3426 domain-containing protein [Ralstonia sp.]MBA4232582.1 DUF3426 domain-containing protein [Ralstonia sp.]MBA4238941.1 DUF3426 domain-containing protein [Ralstonia sp.]MBA4281888.1 DUF3426 domain-containing protein [Ralstonia sp.]